MKNIVVLTALNDDSINLIKTFKDNPILQGATLHFYHCFEINIYTTDLSPYIYPTEEQYEEIKKSSINILKEIAAEVATSSNKTQFQCEFSQSPKQKAIEYLQSINADCAIVATRGKHGIEGLFSSSFAEHLVKFSPCDIYILKEKN